MKPHGIQLIERGWTVCDFVNPDRVYRVREALEGKLAEIMGKKVSLEKYHLENESQEDEIHYQIQIEMNQFYREREFGVEIIRKEASFFQDLVGIDLVVQTNPYLRITRPNKERDNLGYHRDTHYGGSAFELSVWIPFVDVPKESTLGVLSGSHVHSEATYPTTQTLNSDPEIVKGSPKHQVGFLYAPKQMDPSVGDKIEFIPLKMGQALIFCLPLVHGSRLNAGKTTRWSSDIRIMNAYAPVNLGTRSTHYETISHSPITLCANQYHENDRRDSVEMEMCLRGN